MFIKFTAVALAVVLSVVNGEGFHYPSDMPEPKDVQNAMWFYRYGAGQSVLKPYETPIQLRILSILTVISWNCMAVYHPTLLDAVTSERPLVVAEDDLIEQFGNEYTYVLCAQYSWMIIDKFLLGEEGGSDQHIQLLNSLHLDFDELVHFDLNQDVKDCPIDDADECLNDVASIHGYTPEIMGSIVAYQVIDYLNNDGWNQDGSIGCTSNCRAYADISGYKPNFKDPFSWKPLVEDNGMGFYYHYDHVTPHIGFTGRTKVISREEADRRFAPNPNYNYGIETDLVIDRLADLAVNDTQKMLVEFFDDKIKVAISTYITLETELNWSYEERQMYLVGINLAEYDSVILAWKEKIRYDLIRPTSIIKRRGNGEEKLKTYGGPTNNGVTEIDSQDFEAYHRVMPHAEYPSGSGCICQSRAQFVDRLLKERHNRPNSVWFDIPKFEAGSSIIEPGKTPSKDIEIIRLPNLTAMYEMCGESRLWGGMHFGAAVTGSYELCDGLGDTAYEYVEKLLDGKPLVPQHSASDDSQGDDDDDDE